MSLANFDFSALGEPVKGASALGSDRRRPLGLTRTLALTDFRLRFFGSALGYLWQLMQPLMLFGVLYTVFSQLLNFSGSERFYPVALLAGIVMFGFVSEATTGSVRAIVNRESLVRKIEFPRWAVPLSTVLTSLLNFSLNLVPVFVFLLASGGRSRWPWLELPLLVGVVALWLVGLSMILSLAFVRFRDLEPIWTVVLQILFYATPIFYTLDTAGSKTGKAWIGQLLVWNPFAAILQQFRDAVIDPSHVSEVSAIGGTARLLVPLMVVVITVVIGLAFFVRAAPTVAEEL